MSFSLTVTDTDFGGTGTLASGTVSNFFEFTLTATLVGPTLGQILKGSHFQMTAELFADINLIDPRTNTRDAWSLDPSKAPMAIQKVSVNRTSKVVSWDNTQLHDSANDDPLFHTEQIGVLDLSTRFQAGSGRVNSLWGRFQWPDFSIDLPGPPKETLNVSASQIIVNISTHLLEWRFKPVSLPRK